MKLCLFIFFYIFCVIGASKQENSRKFEKYRNCMRNNGISSWKVVSAVSNATSYNMLNYQWNKVFDFVFPIAIFIPSSVYDVQATVVCGYNADIQLVPNSGRHSYAGLSLGTNDAIIVDFRYMNSIEINEDEEYFTVGPGALIGHVIAKLWTNGGWGIALGTCMTVAMGGFVMGGGYSLYSSLYGLAIDNLLEINMVDAQGNAVTANPTQNTDLWWAMRGVGAGYIGLVTSFKLKMFRARDLKLTIAQRMFNGEDFPNVMDNYVKWLDWVKQNDETVTTTISGGRTGVFVRMIHVQDPNKQPVSSKAVLAALPKYFPNATETDVSYKSFIETVIGLSEISVTIPEPTSFGAEEESPETTLEKHLNFYSSLTKDVIYSEYSLDKTFFVDKRIRARDLYDVQEVFAKIPETCSVSFLPHQGAIAVPQSTDCAYVHRDAIFDCLLTCYGWNFEQAYVGEKWMNEFMIVARFMDSGHTYQNYPDKDLNDYLWRYYGRNLKKLIRIKRKWDPYGYFRSEQSIPIRR
ncbi:Xylooligosaccharide oxidase [Pseudolycoriella hygida]|uniref:Xylooligosaccharide oxidase n=1 Tax=Pseudolycoriella hygida TaxID=35572 RepID=A0A9Q0N6L6_9DIPT|nr:Xylooligosaccharide oxidase [Pseudolycoriella hygida]